MAGAPRFHSILTELAVLHGKKADGYSREGDPYHNIRQSSALGIPPWVAAMVQASDKLGARVEQEVKEAEGVRWRGKSLAREKSR